MKKVKLNFKEIDYILRSTLALKDNVGIEIKYEASMLYKMLQDGIKMVDNNESVVYAFSYRQRKVLKKALDSYSEYLSIKTSFEAIKDLYFLYCKI